MDLFSRRFWLSADYGRHGHNGSMITFHFMCIIIWGKNWAKLKAKLKDKLKPNWTFSLLFLITSFCLVSRFEKNGGQVIQKSISRLADFSAKEFDAVFNCSGLGAQKLCNDLKVVPIRGQIVKVKAPWVKTAFYADYDTYILPGFDGIVTLGSTTMKVPLIAYSQISYFLFRWHETIWKLWFDNK